MIFRVACQEGFGGRSENGGRNMKKGKGISKETLRGISEELTEVKVDEGEWEDMLILVGDLLKGVRALDEVDLKEVSPAFSYNPGGERNAGY
jgi:hypothetical protein